MQTLRGIYHNIDESNFKIMIDNFVLYFSSETNKGRFLGRYDEYYRKLDEKLTKIYETDYTALIILSLYKNIEKRGFRVYYNDRRILDNQFRIEV